MKFVIKMFKNPSFTGEFIFVSKARYYHWTLHALLKEVSKKKLAKLLLFRMLIVALTCLTLIVAVIQYLLCPLYYGSRQIFLTALT